MHICIGVAIAFAKEVTATGTKAQFIRIGVVFAFAKKSYCYGNKGTARRA